MYYEVKVKYEKTMENGMQKKVSEPYMVGAVSFTDAEKRIFEELTPYMSGDFAVVAIKQTNYKEITPSPNADDDKWYKCKVVYLMIDEKSGREKKLPQNWLIQAGDMDSAKANLNNIIKQSMMDIEVTSISETRIMDVYWEK